MPHYLHLEAKVETDDGQDLASLMRDYELKSLDLIPQTIEHFGQTAALLLKGAEETS